MQDRALEVYGLLVTGIDVPGARPGGPAVLDAPRLTVRQEVGPPVTDVESRLEPDRAVIRLIEDGLLEVTRDPSVATYHVTERLGDEELLHPWLVPAAATVSHWHGRRVLHGGVVGRGGSAVAVLADREGGKSSLLAWLALHAGLDVLSDDLVVVDGDTVFAGPRSVDLRPDARTGLTGVEEAVPVRRGTRLRLRLAGGSGAARLLGLVVLEWGGEEPVLEPVGPAGRLQAVLPHALVDDVPLGTAGLLGFVRYPLWRLRRPRRWDGMAGSAALLSGLLR